MHLVPPFHNFNTKLLQMSSEVKLPYTVGLAFRQSPRTKTTRSVCCRSNYEPMLNLCPKESINSCFFFFFFFFFNEQRQKHAVLPDWLSSLTYRCLPASPVAEWAGKRPNAKAIGSLMAQPLPCFGGAQKGTKSCASTKKLTLRRQSCIQRPLGLNLPLSSLKIIVVPELKGFGKLCSWC